MAGLFVAIDPRPDRDRASLVEGSLAALSAPGPETSAFHEAGPAILAVRGDGPELSLGTSGPVVAVVDGRLDNRAELVQRLDGLGLLADPRPSGGALVAAAWRAWGGDCAMRLAGDFAFALWDGEAQRLFAARDATGVRPLVFQAVGDRLVLASGVGAIVAAADAAPDLHWDFLRDLCARRYERWQRETCYRGIERLAAGESLTWSPTDGRARRESFDHLGSGVEPFAGTDDEALEAFRVALGEAVRRRIEIGRPVGLLTSGGLDSSAVACLAEDLVAAGSPARGWLLTTLFDRTPGADEREYFDAVAERCPHWPALRVPADDLWAFRAEDRLDDLEEPSIESSSALVAALADRAREEGCITLLGGHWGDQLLTSDAYSATSVLRDVAPADRSRELPHFQRLSRHPRWLVSAFARWHPWLGEGLRRRVGGRHSVTAPGLDALPSQAARISLGHLAGGLTAASLANLANLGRRLGVSWSFPYLDRDLVRLRLGLASRLFFYSGTTKFILRNALPGVLPERVRNRRDSARFDDLIERGFSHAERGRIREILTKPRILEAGLVTIRELGQLENRCSAGDADAEVYRSLGRALNVEMWLRRRSAR